MGQGLGAVWLGRHGMFRDISRQLDEALAGLGAGRFEPRGFAQPFSGAVDMLLGELETHHHVEDHHYFPAFAKAAPQLKRGFEVLDGDHDVLHEAIAALAAGRDAVTTALRETRAAEAADRGRTAMAAFASVLLPHLDDEEDLVIPLILEGAGDPRFR